MKRFFSLTCALVLHTLSLTFNVVVAGSLYAQSIQPTDFAALEIDSQLKVGVILPLTGKFAEAGEDIKRGILLANDELPPAKRFQFYVEDNAHDLKTTAVAARKLIEVDKVSTIISIWNGSEVVAPLAEEAGVLNLAIRWNPHLAEKYSNTFTIGGTYIAYVNDLVKLLKIFKVKRPALIMQESTGWSIAADLLTKQLQAAKTPLVTQVTFLGGYSEPALEVGAALEKNPDLLIFFAVSPELDDLILEFKKKTSINFTGHFGDMATLDLIENKPFVSQTIPSQEFVDKFKIVYGTAPISRAAHGYELVHLLAIASAETDKAGEERSLENIRHRLTTIKDYQSVLGPLSVGANRTIELPISLRVVEGGVVKTLTFKELDKFMPDEK